ncbi:MAG TPA: HTTM domain-containing protein [Pirellulaceae bacterium]|nr:HTTM domain-containing protein [Pirellulaceae bacterium]
MSSASITDAATGPAPWRLRGACRTLAGGWQTFFHAPCDARVAAAVRIAFAMVMLLGLAILYPDLDLWFTDAGVLPQDASREVAPPQTWSIFWQVPATEAAVRICFWIAVTQAVCLLLGLASNLNMLCLFVWLMSIENRNFLIIDGEDRVLRMLAFMLIWAPLGRCWSVDSLVRRWWKGSGVNCGQELSTLQERGPQLTEDPLVSVASRYAAPGWGLRLVQIEICLVFFSAGLCKLGGDAWIDGTALYYVARLDDYFGRFPTPAWPFDSPWAVAAMTWSVIAVELLAPVFIWFKETRRITLAVVVLFHLANEWTMHLFLFHWVMLTGWLAFVSPSDFAWLGRLFRKSKSA